MMKRLLVIPLLLLSSAICLADDIIKLVRPKATITELQVTQLNIENEAAARLHGRVWVNGTFIARWPAGASALNSGPPEYILIPDKRSASKLPYFYLRDSSFHHAYRVTTIDLQNGEDALRIAFSESSVQKLLAREVDSMRVTGSFFIEDYEVGIECDAPWARAVLLKTNIPNQVAQIHQKAPDRC